MNAGLPSLRTIMPLDFDTRHTVKTEFDFHYRTGKDYDGPIVNGKKILEKAGINIIFTAYSGHPFTERITPTPEAQSGVVSRAQIRGSINGSNLPPQYNMDLTADKIFDFSHKNIDGSQTRYALRVFLWVQNLFNVANVLGVYSYTGSAYNDGYLNSPYAQSQINAATSAQSFIDLYNVRMVNPDRFALPRLTRIGVSLQF